MSITGKNVNVTPAAGVERHPHSLLTKNSARARRPRRPDLSLVWEPVCLPKRVRSINSALAALALNHIWDISLGPILPTLTQNHP